MSNGEAALRSFLPLLVTAVVVACSSAKPNVAATPDSARRTPRTRIVRETVTVRDPELERRLGRLELRVLEKEAQVEELQTRLDAARDEVVSTMAKLQTLASRAEAASAIAEADVAIQTLRGEEGSRQLQELTQATRFQAQGTDEFNKQNYGGALYLANQAKAAATAGRTRLSNRSGAARAGETQFVVPVRLKVANRGNVREGPGTNFSIAFAVEPGAALTAFSYTDEWIRVSDDGGRSGWIFRTLIARP